MNYRKYPTCPSGDSLVLLQAAYCQSSKRAEQAWRTWRARHSLEQCELKMHRVMPIIFHRHGESVLGREDAAILRGVYRYHWTRNQIQLRKATRAVAALNQAGVPSLILKGLALALQDYPKPGLRPMWDLDLLVAPEQRGLAAQILGQLGWKSTRELPELDSQHGFELKDDQGSQLDLHWFSMPESRWPKADDAFWAASVPLPLAAGVETRQLSREHKLVHVCVHGAKDAGNSLGWVCDAMQILQAAPLDFTRVIEAARQRRVVLIMHLTLSYLREQMDAPVPLQALEELRGQPTTWADRLYFYCKVAYRHHLSFWAYPVLDYLRCQRQPGLRDFFDFLRRRWGLARTSQLPGYALRRIWNRLIRRRHS